MSTRAFSQLAAALVLLAAIPVVGHGAEPAGELTQPEAQEALVGRSWRLVRIMSMDDSVYTPRDGAVYSMELDTDGSVRVRSDCNRGTGSWTSKQAGQIEFGPIAATDALCPPGSLDERYRAQFPWVRSYVMRDGHLFLATMADGSIIEFAPMPDPLAAATHAWTASAASTMAVSGARPGRLIL